MSDNDEKDIMDFSIDHKEGYGLQNYIRYHAFPEEEAGLMRTYIVRDNISSELVGYFSLKTGLISLNERAEEITKESTKYSDIICSGAIYVPL